MQHARDALHKASDVFLEGTADKRCPLPFQVVFGYTTLYTLYLQLLLWIFYWIIVRAFLYLEYFIEVFVQYKWIEQS